MFGNRGNQEPKDPSGIPQRSRVEVEKKTDNQKLGSRSERTDSRERKTHERQDRVLRGTAGGVPGCGWLCSLFDRDHCEPENFPYLL